MQCVFVNLRRSAPFFLNKSVLLVRGIENALQAKEFLCKVKTAALTVHVLTYH